MTDDAPNPIRPTDDQARALALQLLCDARHGALGVVDPAKATPIVSRVAVGLVEGQPTLLISTLAAHTRALTANAACSLMVGEPKPTGDPLTHPRLTLQCQARVIDKALARDEWLRDHPKSKLYIDFTDFEFWQLRVEQAFLNGGFGKAYVLSAPDFTPG